MHAYIHTSAYLYLYLYLYLYNIYIYIIHTHTHIHTYLLTHIQRYVDAHMHACAYCGTGIHSAITAMVSHFLKAVAQETTLEQARSKLEESRVALGLLSASHSSKR